MVAFEGIGGFLMSRCREGRWFEAIFGVTSCTVPLILPLSKLPAVPVLMAVPALCVRQSSVEVCGLVAFGTGYAFMLPLEREVGSLMIEV